ncbi:hypothetical protein IPJ63_03040 [Candidatus Nomurabacteria bacterium]|nr:MAG: hypothetical protein IPJ63_03040 [Candidatus Nomurabacteria bacterium]
MSLFNKNKKHIVGIFLLGMLFVFSAEVSSAVDLSISAQVGAGGGGDVGGGGGGGGGGGANDGDSTVNFSGYAYPLSQVIVLRDGIEVVQTIAGPDAKFSISISDLPEGNYTFSVLAEDYQERRSTLFTFPLYLTDGLTTTISGIFIAPSIAIDKSVVKQGEQITIFGQSTPNSEVSISVNSLNEFILNTFTDSSGIYLSVFNTSLLEIGDHTTRSYSKYLEATSSYSSTLAFEVSDKAGEVLVCGTKADVSSDCRVNLVDFSMLAYWFERGTPPVAFDLSGDGKITLIDFSIMAYYWTG